MPLTFFDIIKLGGSLALFLYGMSMLGTGLERASGGRLEQTLEKLTGNIFKSVALGALVTAVIQSSGATTVITVGLVSAGIIKLRQAIGIIMGANIGTTITAHILRLSDISGDNFFLQFVKPSTLAPLVAIIGIVLFMLPGRSRKRNIGEILLGVGILFTGMFGMEDAVSVLSDSPEMANLFTAFGSNVPLGILVGALVTVLLQSSSASVGILQALSTTGAITYASAIPIILGQNIGSCATAMIASVGASKNARRTAMAHLYFNVIGAVTFCAIVYGANAFFNFDFWDTVVDKGSIANFHTIFNVSVTLMFIPLAGLLERLATISVPSKGEEIDADVSALDERFFASPGLAVEQARTVLVKMAALARENLILGVGLLKKYDVKVAERMKEGESVIDRMEDKINSYMLKLDDGELGEEASMKVTTMLQMNEEFERMGDYADNIREYAEDLWAKNISFSGCGEDEIGVISDAVLEMMDNAIRAAEKDDRKACAYIEPLENVVDEMVELVRSNHLERLRRGECSGEAGAAYVETLLNLERVADHCSNVGVCLAAQRAGSSLSKHEFVRRMHNGNTEHFTEKYMYYREKYYDQIKQDD